jgi:teichuronic acid biosynthesis glycosyltransferase TuaH
MTVTSSTTRANPAVNTPGARKPPLALAVADANWFTTQNLFAETPGERASTLLLKCIDYYNALRQGRPPWQWTRRLDAVGPGLWQRDLVLPSGWMKQFPHVGMKPIARSIKEWRRLHVSKSPPLVLVITYPHYLYLHEMVRPDFLVYFNIDDYSQYWPWCADDVERLEREAVRKADLTVCVSKLRSDELKRSTPEASERIQHLPHGFPSSRLIPGSFATKDYPPAGLTGLPRPILGFVGTLEDRIDWPLLEKLALQFPKASLVLIGRRPRRDFRTPPWQSSYSRVKALPNVHLLGWRPQEQIDDYIRSFDVCLIPYSKDHPFNRVCCPTKIMDYMGAGRPIVSTALPECLLYQELFEVAGDHDSFLEAVKTVLSIGEDKVRSAERHAYAMEHTCKKTVERLLNWLPN